jgi:hypothetical protein
MNPDAFIVRANVAHEAPAWWFFTEYAGNLSADAVPDLVAALPKLHPDHRQAIAKGLNERYAKLHNQVDWRSLTWGQCVARMALQASSGKSRRLRPANKGKGVRKWLPNAE